MRPISRDPASRNDLNHGQPPADQGSTGWSNTQYPTANAQYQGTGQTAPSQHNGSANSLPASLQDIQDAITQLEPQRQQLANMDGFVDREIAALQLRLQSAYAQPTASNPPAAQLPGPVAEPSERQAPLARTSLRNGTERLPPFLTSSPLRGYVHSPQPVRDGFAPTDKSHASPQPDVPERAQGVKTPRGYHIRPDIRDEILRLHGTGVGGAEIARGIPGLKARQASHVIEAASANHNSRKKARGTQRAVKITGDPNATAADYHRIKDTERAIKITGDPKATAADYTRIKGTERARKITGNPNATAADYQRILKVRKRAAQGGTTSANSDHFPIHKQSFATRSTRPIVALENLQQVRTRGWNAGDRLSIPHQDGLYHFEVTRNLHEGEQTNQGDIRPIVQGG